MGSIRWKMQKTASAVVFLMLFFIVTQTSSNDKKYCFGGRLRIFSYPYLL